MKRKLLFVILMTAIAMLGFGQNSKKIALSFEEKALLAPDAGIIMDASRDVGNPASIPGALLKGADFLVNAQADVTEDNAGNGSPDTDPDDGGWDWVSLVIPHSTATSPTNIYGATAAGLYYAYLEDADASYMTAMQDAADIMIANANIRSSSDLIFLMNFQDLPGITADIYKSAAKSKFDARIAFYGSATAFAQYIRDVRHGQGYDNGIIPWDIGSWAVVAQMLEDRYPSDTYDYALAADDIAEVIYQDSYLTNPGYFDPDENDGWDPDYANTDYWWYTLGITGIIDAFEAANVHTSEIAGLKAILDNCQYPEGAFSNCYGANPDDQDWQSTAYTIKTLATIDQTGNQGMINHACYWLAATQDETTGAWFYSNGDQYPEVGGENTMALYFGENAANVFVDNDFTPSSCGGHLWGYDAFSTIQDGIDAIAEGGTVFVYPGNYDETASGRYLYNANGPYQFGLFFGVGKDNIAVRGVDASGNVITENNNVLATITTNATNSFGYSGVFIEADGITITGLKFMDNYVGGNPDNNKTIEVIGDNIKFEDNIFGLTYGGSFYINDWRYSAPNSHVESFIVKDNLFQYGGSVDVSSGVGMSGDVANRIIQGNTFSGDGEDVYWANISFNGIIDDVGWFIYPVGGAIITGNSFTGIKIPIRSRGTVNESDFNWTSYWENNTFEKAVVAWDQTAGKPRSYDYESSGSTMNNTRRFSVMLQEEIDHAISGDLVKVAAGTYVEQLHITTNNLTINGAGKANTTVKSPADLTLFFNSGSGNNYPVVFIENVNNCTVSNLTIDGDEKGNANYRFQGIAFWNAGGTINNVDVLRIIDTPFSGAQHGVGVYSYNNTGGPYTINCSNMLIDDYQKNAMALGGNGLTVNLDNITTIGAGPTSVTAQNGIQVAYGAGGTMNACNVSGNIYTGTGWAASGFLIYQGTGIAMTNITATNNYTGIYIQDFNGSLSGGTVTNTDPDSWDGIYVMNVIAAPREGAGERYFPSPLEEDYINDQEQRSARDFDLSNLTVTGHGKIDSWGVYFSSSADLLTGSMTNCTVTGWDLGVYTRENGGTVSVISNNNKIFGNGEYGFYSNTAIAQDAEDNWWGHASGPLDISNIGLYNPLGEGDVVSDYVDYDPWYADEAKTYKATTVVTNILNEDQGVYYYTLQDAINAAELGDVIEVTGTHNVKDIVVNKGLKIAAAAGGAKFIGLDGSRSGTGFTINTTEPVAFAGATFENYDLAIDFEAFGSASITNCKFINCVAAVNNQTTVDIDADNNYWGHATGPKDDSPIGLYNPYGQGSEVSDYVDYQPWFTSEDLDIMPVDISIVNNACGHLQVKVRPNSNMNGQLTTALFAVKWMDASYPDPAVLTNITSSYNIDFQYYETSGAVRYAVFGLETNALVNWTAGTEYVFVEFDVQQNQPEGTVSDFEIANDAWAAANNALYYMEYWGSDYTGYIYGFADEVYLADCDLQLHLKAFLQGPYNTTTNVMKTDLITYIPLNQPFNVAPWNYPGSESITTVPTDMVDWVLVELRSTADGAPVARKAGLLFKDGTVRSHVDSFFDVYFTGDFMPNSDYFVVLTARNHMPVMSAAVVNIPNAGDRYDFSNMTGYPSYGGATAQVLLEAGVNGMISGDVNKDGKLIYSGTNNDRDPILAKIVAVSGDPYINGVIQGYYQEDLTMNSWVKYSGSANDQRLIILNIIELTGIYNLNQQYSTLVPGAVVKSGYSNPGAGPVDITLTENENSLDVELITKADFIDSYVTNIQFTLSWDGNNPMMDAIVDDYMTEYKLEAQGAVSENDGRHYLTFVMAEAILLPSDFRAGDRLNILSFDKGSFAGKMTKSTLENDAFTLQTNGDYYISIIGIDQTGQVTAGATGSDELSIDKGALQIYPNPACQGYVNLAFMPETSESVFITVTDLSSRIVKKITFDVNKAVPVVKQIDLNGLSKGIYFINLKGNQISRTGKIEVQ